MLKGNTMKLKKTYIQIFPNFNRKKAQKVKYNKMTHPCQLISFVIQHNT